MKEKYSKKDFYSEIYRLYNLYGNIDKNIFNKYSKIKVNFHFYCTKYGGIKKICEELGIDHRLYNEKTENEILIKAKKIFEENGKITKELCSKNGISSCVVNRIFGNFENLYKKIGIENIPRKNIPIEDVLKDIKSFYESTDNFSSTEYRKHGKYSCCVINRFGGWKNLLNILGIENKDRRIGFDYIDSQLKKLAEKYGTLNRDIVESNTNFSWDCLFWYFKNTKELLENYNLNADRAEGRSNPERLITKILKSLNINFQKEKTFEWLINTNGEKLFIDFYFPDKNFALEYDGQQHYKNVKYFYKTEEKYLDSIKRDKIKNELLKEHNIPLVRVSYKDKITESFIKNIYEQF